MNTRELTYDEKKAAEAAFRGLPCNPKWSAAAKKVYEGLVQAMSPSFSVVQEEAEAETEAIEEANSLVPMSPSAGQRGKEAFVGSAESTDPNPALDREEAVQAGLLVDVTPLAQELGINLPVGMSKSLWEIGITASNQLDAEQHSSRARDVLMALRLHLETSEVTSPWIKFPALLSFPPDIAPQLCSLYAVAHKDETTPYSLTLLLPHEMSSIKSSTDSSS
jgi:hypothetical protein